MTIQEAIKANETDCVEFIGGSILPIGFFRDPSAMIHKEYVLGEFRLIEKRITISRNSLALAWDSCADVSLLKNADESTMFKTLCKRLGL